MAAHHLDSFSLLLWVNLLNMNEFQLDLLKNPLDVETGLRYSLSLSALGQSESAVRAAQKAVDSLPALKSINPFVLQKYFVEEDFVRLNALPKVKGKNFVPSFVIDSNGCSLHNLLNMMFVHIPKCAGTYFFSPLNLLAISYSDYLKDKFVEEQDLIGIFTFSRIDSNSVLEGYVSSFSARADDSKNAIHMVSTHGISYANLGLMLSAESSPGLECFAFWRDPVSRLRSAISYLLQVNNFDENVVIDAIEREDPFLCNSIFYNCFGSRSNNSQVISGSNFSIDALFSADCDGHLDTLQSYFMTMYGLPNLLVESRLNVSRLASEKKLLVDQLLLRCLDLGFVSKDLSQEVLNLKDIGSLRISKVKSQLSYSRYLHPLTLILEEANVGPFTFSAKLIKTIDLPFS